MTREYLRFPGFRRRALTLSYDDGVRQDKRLISIMKKHGIKGTFNINSGLFSAERSEVEKGRMTVEEAYELYADSGMEVAVHGVHHLSLIDVPVPQMVADIIDDRKNLEKIFGRPITGMAYAYGTHNDTAVEVLRNCGIKYARTTVATMNFDITDDFLRLPATCHHRVPNLMELAEKFVNEDEKPRTQRLPKLFYLWGHSYEFDNADNWDVIERFCEFMGGRDNIWYATNGEIVDYVKAFDSLVFSVDATRVYNPTATDVYLCISGREYLAKAGATIELS